VVQNDADWFRGNEAQRLGFGNMARGYTRKKMRLIKGTEVAVEIVWILAFFPGSTRMKELNVRIFHTQFFHKGKVAKGRRKEQLSAIYFYHALKRLLYLHVLRNILLLEHLHVRKLLDRVGAFGVALSVAIVIAGAYIDKSNDQGF